jgi:hypothetical protein
MRGTTTGIFVSVPCLRKKERNYTRKVDLMAATLYKLIDPQENSL